MYTKKKSQEYGTINYVLEKWQIADVDVALGLIDKHFVAVLPIYKTVIPMR